MNFTNKIIILFYIICFFISPVGVYSQEQNPKNETEEIDFAHGLLQKGLYEMAWAQYLKFIESHPKSPHLEEAYFAIGESSFLAANYPKALEAFTFFKEKYPQAGKVPEANLRLGQSLIQLARYNEAVAVLNSHEFETKLKSQTLQAYYFYLAKACHGQNDLPLALNNYLKAAEVSDSAVYTTSALINAGEIQTQNGRYNEAVATYQRALESASEETQKGFVTYKIGETFYLANDYDQAVISFKQVLDQFPKLEITKEALENLLLSHFNKGSYEEVLNAYQTYAAFIKDEAGYADIHLSAIKALMELNKNDEAVALLDKIFVYAGLSEADKRRIILAKAETFIRQNKFKEVLEFLETPLIKQEKDNDQALFLKAQGHYGLADYEKAYQFFNEVKSSFLNSEYAQASLLGMAHSRYDSGNMPHARELFEAYFNSASGEPLKSESLFYAAVSAAKIPDHDQAILHAEYYLKSYPGGLKYEDTLFLLGDLYAQTNQPQKTIDLLNVSLADGSKITKLDTANFLIGYNYQLLTRADEALQYYAKVTDKNDPQTYTSALKNTATLYLVQKKDSEAAAVYDRVLSELEGNFLDVKTYLWVLNQYLKEKKFQDILRLTEKAQVHFSDSGKEEVSYFRAESFRELNDFENAIKHYESILNSNDHPYRGVAHIGKGLTFIKQEKWDEAKNEFNKADDENSEDPTITMRARFELGNIAKAQKNHEEALKFYILVSTLYSDEVFVPQALMSAGEALENLNRPTEASKMYENLLNEYPESELTAAAQGKIKTLNERKS